MSSFLHLFLYFQLVLVFKLVEPGQINELGLGKGKNVRKLI